VQELADRVAIGAVRDADGELRLIGRQAYLV
jgi:hypothetical protein